MENYITSIKIENLRHLKDITLTLSKEERKHLILTGKNGSGKTSLLEAMKSFLSMYEDGQTLEWLVESINIYQNSVNSDKVTDMGKFAYENTLIEKKKKLQDVTKGIEIEVVSEVNILEKYKKGEFIIAFYGANRNYTATTTKHIEKIEFKDSYRINENPGKELVKYLLDLKTTQALAEKAKKNEKAYEIEIWFNKFEELLQNIFDDINLKLDFDIETFEFFINTKNREPFGFNEMSSGYSAILEIVADLMLRMEKNAKGFYNMQGIVLIDELETHLHLDLQKKIFPFLTDFFPKIQFIVTTHSPFILSSAENTLIYDLENKIEIDNGLRNLPYSGIVEGYFEVDTLSEELKTKFNRYKELYNKETLEDRDYDELADLEFYLDEIPDYLAVDFSSEYSKMKLEFENRG